MYITTDHGRDFEPRTLPIGQMYHVAVDNRVPYYIYSNMQDDGTMRGPEHCRSGWRDETAVGSTDGRLRIRLHHARPHRPNIVWATCYGNEVTRWDARTRWRAP